MLVTGILGVAHDLVCGKNTRGWMVSNMDYVTRSVDCKYLVYERMRDDDDDDDERKRKRIVAVVDIDNDTIHSLIRSIMYCSNRYVMSCHVMSYHIISSDNIQIRCVTGRNDFILHRIRHFWHHRSPDGWCGV